MNIKKITLFLVAFLLCFSVVSCKPKKNTTYKIEFKTDGGTLTNAPTEFKNSVGLSSLPTPTKNGYDFVGWFMSESEAKAGDASKAVKRIAENYGKDVTLYAGWKSKTAKHTLTLNPDGGKLPDGEQTVVEFTEGVGLSSLPTPTKEGFTFVGWVDDKGQTYTSVPASCKSDLTLKAKWTETGSGESYTLTFDLVGGQWPAGSEDKVPATYSSTTGLKLSEVPTPVKVDENGKALTFDGWYEDGVKMTEIEIGTTRNLTLVAEWTTDVFYTITYVCNEGVLPTDASTQYKFGVGCILPEPTPNDPTQKFLGWYDESDAKIERITSVMARNITLTAKFGKGGIYTPLWELNQIGFNGNGMNFAIKVNPVADYDPNNPDYTGSNRSLKQLHQSMVEAAYDITIIWSNWDDAAPWGPERVKFINKKYLADDFGDVYVLSIASQWIPTLVKGGSIAELYDINTENGIYTNLPYLNDAGVEVVGYTQNSTVNDATSVKGKVYGYAPETAHPDYFMYYNVDLVKKYGLEDPAEMWLKGEWTLTNFETWARTAQNQLTAAGGKALDMGFAEAVIGMVASTGNRMTSVTPPLINLTRQSVTDSIEKLQGFYADGLYYARSVQDVSPGFSGGTTILHHGDLWFMKSSDRFNPSKMTFTIGVVPYPTADGQGGTPITSSDEEDGILLDNGEYLMIGSEYVTGVDMSNSSFKVPFTGTSCYAVLNVSGNKSKNGITTEIITHVFHDLYSALGPDPNSKVNLTPEESYRAFLKTKFDRDIDIEVIMSCQESTYFEIMEILSMTVGDGSHFGPNAWWPLAANLVKSSDAPATKLNEVLEVYKQAMRDLGYNVR